MIAPAPLTYADWRALKAATRHRRYLERLADADEAGADDWLAVLPSDRARCAAWLYRRGRSLV